KHTGKEPGKTAVIRIGKPGPVHEDLLSKGLNLQNNDNCSGSFPARAGFSRATRWRSTPSGFTLNLSIICPEQVMNYWARFSTTPRVFRPEKVRGPTRRAVRIRRADTTPMPGTRSRVS